MKALKLPSRHAQIAILAVVMLCSETVLAQAPTTPFAAPESPIATEELGGTLLSLTPHVTYEQALLRVVGPHGYEASRTFYGESVWMVDLLADRVDNVAARRNDEARTPSKNTGVLMDGHYVWEARVRLPDKARQTANGVFYVRDGVARLPFQKRRISEKTHPSTEPPQSKVGPKLNSFDDSIHIIDSNEDRLARLVLAAVIPDALVTKDWYVHNLMGSFEITNVGVGSALMILDNNDVGLRTRAPANRLHIFDDTGEEKGLRLTGRFHHPILDITFQSDWDLEARGSSFVIQDARTGNLPFRISEGAPSSAFRIFNDGDIKIGSGGASAPLHVERFDGSAKLLVEESDSTPATRELLELRNNGGPFFIFNNTDIAQSYSFAMGATGHFLISHQQTGGVQMRLKPNGEARFQGDVYANGVKLTSSREAKTDFAPIDESAVLDKVAELGMSQWRYKREPASARHIGPMAEDFRKVFGLGDGEHISVGDANGILFAAAKALREQNLKLARDLAKREQRIQTLESRLEILESKVLGEH